MKGAVKPQVMVLFGGGFEYKLNRDLSFWAIILIVLVSVSFFVTIKLVNDQRPAPEFFVGVEFAYPYSNSSDLKSLVSDLKSLVDKVKNYTNLFVIGTPQITFNQTLLNETCDYINDAGLSFIVLFTDKSMYSYEPSAWIAEAKQKYGDRFLGVYRYDEPGGNQLDQGRSKMLAKENATAYGNFANAARHYINGLNIHIEYYLNASDRLFTADYGLYWFDYKSGYNTVLAEFGSNQSRELTVALCRGAADAQKKNWGTIITWTYDNPPYIESGKELYEDMTLAYKAGAKYVVVFDSPKIGQYGTLTQEHFDALKNFWDYMRGNSQDFGVNIGKVAYVLPPDYGFGFRGPNDNIWGLWSADNLTSKVWSDANTLITRYDSRLNIVYDDPELNHAVVGHYEKLFFWNEAVT